MKAWTYLLPACLWLWMARRHCERMTIRGPRTAIIAGRVLLVEPTTPEPGR